MRGVIAHGVLLVLMLGFAYETWTRDKTIKVSTGEVPVWDLSVGDLVAVELETTKPDPAAPDKSSQHTIRIEKRSDANGEYWWGIDTRTVVKPKPANADAGSNATPPDTEESTTTREFPLGKSFRVMGSPEPYPLTQMMHDFASMHAVRSLGTATEQQKKDYNLAASQTTLAVIFGNKKTKTLILGDKISGSPERYALDPESGKAYILAGALIDPVESGESTLRPSSLHGFEPTALAAATIDAGGKQKKVSRITTTDDKGVQHQTWADPATGKADQTLANVVDNLDKLMPQSYDATLKPGDMTEIFVVSYQDASGKKIGGLGLYKVQRPGEIPEGGDPTNPPPPETDYYVITEATRVPALVAKTTGQSAEQDVQGLFNAPPPGTAPGTPGAPGNGSAAPAAPTPPGNGSAAPVAPTAPAPAGSAAPVAPAGSAAGSAAGPAAPAVPHASPRPGSGTGTGTGGTE